MAKAKTDKRAATAADRPPKGPQPATGTDRDVAGRAYDLYLARGGEHGHDVDDWLRTEGEMKEAVRSTVA